MALPAGAQPPFEVYLNGVQQREGDDYSVRGSEIVFSRPIVKEGKLGFLRWLSMFIGLFGSYRRNEVVDISYRLGDKTCHIADAPVIPDEEPPIRR